MIQQFSVGNLSVMKIMLKMLSRMDNSVRVALLIKVDTKLFASKSEMLNLVQVMMNFQAHMVAIQVRGQLSSQKTLRMNPIDASIFLVLLVGITIQRHVIVLWMAVIPKGIADIQDRVSYTPT